MWKFSKIFYHLTTATNIKQFLEEGYFIGKRNYFGNGWYFFEDLNYENIAKYPKKDETYKNLLKAQINMEKIFILDEKIQEEIKNKKYSSLIEQLEDISPNSNININKQEPIASLGNFMEAGSSYKSFKELDFTKNLSRKGPFDGQTNLARELHQFLKKDKNIKGFCFYHGYHNNIVVVVYDPSIINIISYNNNLKGEGEWINIKHGNLKFYD